MEFGLCRQQDGTFKVYGAGLLSSVAELQHAISTSDKIKRFDPEVTCEEECIITSYQNAYYYTDSFEEAKDRMRYVREPFLGTDFNRAFSVPNLSLCPETPSSNSIRR